MDGWKSVQLIRKYANCEKCGSELIGNGEGSLEINDDTFYRSCKCGWEIKIEEEK
ncbi:DUF3797 domain-containing protein [Heyndrickxia oleronia]|uniref:DUF3797 domain-containing protein n=1 Tax=Heyndrickxia oleronia TaxID=38875 RepID=UPI00333ACB09